MSVVIYEVEREFKIKVEGLDFDIKGRILRRIKGDDDLNVSYQFEVSHYYQPKNGATTYYPGGLSYGESSKETENNLIDYMSSFTNLGIVKNEKY